MKETSKRNLFLKNTCSCICAFAGVFEGKVSLTCLFHRSLLLHIILCSVASALALALALAHSLARARALVSERDKFNVFQLERDSFINLF